MLFKRALARILVLLIALGTFAALPSPAAALTEADYMAAARNLDKYGIVRGDDRGYRFYDQITRAELAKVLVFSLGLEPEAARYAGSGFFTDTRGHWADGPVSLAKYLGIMKGYPEGDFRPQNPLTYAEVITALSRLAGLEAGSEPWPRTYLAPAAQAGIIPADMDLDRRLGAAASRGDVFVLLWRTLTEVKNYSGQNMLRRYLDARPPALVLDPQPTETADMFLVVSGTAGDASAVLVNGEKTELVLGAFRARVDLRVGPNTVRIQALDDAGNVTEQTVQVTRVQSPADSIALRGPAVVTAGEKVMFTIDLLDQNGQAVATRSGMEAAVIPAGLGDFDPATGEFKAGTEPGSGVISLKFGAVSTSTPVTVEPGGLDRLVITPDEVALDGGAAVAFTARGSDRFGNAVPVTGIRWAASDGTINQDGLFQAPDAAGTFTISATAQGKTGTATVHPPNYQVAEVEVAQPVARLKANGVSELLLTATLRDAAGAVVTDYTGTVTVTSSLPNVAAPVQSTAAVVRGVAQIAVKAGIDAGTARITVGTNLGKAGAAAITVDPQRLQSVRLVGQALPGTSAWATGYVEAIAQDEDGHPMRSRLSQTLLVNLELPEETGAVFVSNGQRTAYLALDEVDAETGDVRGRISVQYPSGTGTIPVTGKAEPANMNWVRVMAGAIRAGQAGLPARLEIDPAPDATAGMVRTVFVNVLDENGYRVTQPVPLTGVEITLQDQNGRTWPAIVSPQAGEGRAEFWVRQDLAGTYTYTAVMQPGNVKAKVTQVVKAGALAALRVTAAPEVLPADNASKTTIRAELVDVLGNRVTAPAYKVLFEMTTSNGALQPMADQSVTTANG
ncbi:MAG TPA: S-layer homology domain-containing protein, partial [Symbiobacteriaceae bacterium]|nr:S-layer homology domain-containing protein [Symbiobacteriaceae bacterium]